MSHILVVSADEDGLAAAVSALKDAGYRVMGTATFHGARRLVAADAPDLIIADQRLGDFNGLHVIVSARAARPLMNAIVMTPVADRGLEADARSLNVECMVTPRDPADWLASIRRTLGPTAN